jgi:hypothetical protein
VPDIDTLRVLTTVGPLLDGIMMNNDFMIAVLPVATKAARKQLAEAATS